MSDPTGKRGRTKNRAASCQHPDGWSGEPLSMAEVMSPEERKIRAAQLRQEAAILSDEMITTADFYILNGGGDPASSQHKAIWKLPGMSDREVRALERQQSQFYEQQAPANPIECARVRHMSLLDAAATGALQAAARCNGDVVAARAYTELGVRCLDAFNKASDRFERGRGLLQQKIFVQHNKFDSGSQAVVQTYQTEAIGHASTDAGRGPVASDHQPSLAPAAMPIPSATRRTKETSKLERETR